MIFLTAGHHKKDSGAVYGKYKEADETIRLRNAITSYLRAKSIVVWNDVDEWDLNRTITEIKKLSKETDIICDIHFNAGSNTATGTEVFVPDNANIIEMNLAKDLVEAIGDVLIIRKRGIKKESQSQYRKLGMMRPIGRNVLIEVCFISNNYDMAQYSALFSFLVERVAGVLMKYLK